MSIASADLFGLLTTKANLNYYTQQLEIWSAKYSANAEKLHKMQSLEEKWEGKYDDFNSASKALKVGSTKVTDDNGNAINGWTAQKYADKVVYQFDRDVLDELTELDMSYDTIKTTMEAQIEMLKAQKESETTNTQEACQDTGLLGQ